MSWFSGWASVLNDWQKVAAKILKIKMSTNSNKPGQLSLPNTSIVKIYKY